MVKALAAKGCTVRTETSASWAMQELPLKEQDFAFPSSKAPADELRRRSGVGGGPIRHTVFVGSWLSWPATTIPTMRLTARRVLAELHIPG